MRTCILYSVAIVWNAVDPTYFIILPCPKLSRMICYITLKMQQQCQENCLGRSLGKGMAAKNWTGQFITHRWCRVFYGRSELVHGRAKEGDMMNRMTFVTRPCLARKFHNVGICFSCLYKAEREAPCIFAHVRNRKKTCRIREKIMIHFGCS